MKSNLTLLKGNSQEVELMPEESLPQYLGARMCLKFLRWLRSTHTAERNFWRAHQN